MIEELRNFAEELQQGTTEMMEDSTNRNEAFTKYILDEISETAHLNEPKVFCSTRTNAAGSVIGQIHGYAISGNGQTVSLFYTLYNANPDSEMIPAADYNKAIARLQGYYKEALRGLYHDLSPNDPAYALAKYICTMDDEIATVRLCVLTNGIVKNQEVKKCSIYNKNIQIDCWDIKKLYINLHSGLDHIPVIVNFKEEYDYQIPYIEMAATKENYRCILAMLPGQFLYEIYERYNTDLLQNNVRYFLGFKGKGKTNANIGILDTLKTAPHMFLAYNNGITATATDVTVSSANGKSGFLEQITDLQILNGGQTTASIFFAKKLHPEIDLSEVFVQIKIIVLNEGAYDMIADITKYSNSQSKIKYADFSSNNRFNVKLQEISRTLYAPDKLKNNNLTHWYYERVRGQYDIDRKKYPGVDNELYFERINPKEQRLKREIIAKLWFCWRQEPYRALAGSQKCYEDFIDYAVKEEIIPDELFFKQTVALVILYNHLNRTILSREYGSLRQAIICYAISMLSMLTVKKLDLIRIWDNQDISKTLRDFIGELAPQIKVFFQKANSDTSQLMNWCRRQDTWKRVSNAAFHLNYAALKEESTK